MTGNATDYGSLADLLNRSGSPLPLAELHGGLCGVICASGRDAADNWLTGLLDDCASDPGSMALLTEQLTSLGRETWLALYGMSLEFAPLLPDDDSGMDERAEALALWCHGFLAGLVIGGLDLVNETARLSEPVTELVRDFAEISKAGAETDAAEDADQSDAAFVELVEYVRVGAQLIFEELVPESSREVGRTIH